MVKIDAKLIVHSLFRCQLFTALNFNESHAQLTRPFPGSTIKISGHRIESCFDTRQRNWNSLFNLRDLCIPYFTWIASPTLHNISIVWMGHQMTHKRVLNNGNASYAEENNSMCVFVLSFGFVLPKFNAMSTTLKVKTFRLKRATSRCFSSSRKWLNPKWVLIKYTCWLCESQFVRGIEQSNHFHHISSHMLIEIPKCPQNSCM